MWELQQRTRFCGTLIALCVQVRSRLPDLCKGCGVEAEELERHVMQLLHSSVLDTAVHALEAKAGGKGQIVTSTHLTLFLALQASLFTPSCWPTTWTG